MNIKGDLTMIKRLYENVLESHYAHNNEAIFLSGPRQVGKTTISKAIAQGFDHSLYLNWDNVKDRRRILDNTIPLLNENNLGKVFIIFDEIHKLENWKGYLKGIFDKHKETISFLVTGSSRLNIYRRGGDSMMGRYFLYRVHPFSVAELLNTTVPQREVRTPQKLEGDLFQNLLQFGGFPKPYVSANIKTYNRWKNQRLERLFEEDIRDSVRVYEAEKMQVLANILQYQTGHHANYTALSKKIQVSDQTVRTWISHLESFYYCFSIKPWSTNIARSLLKEPTIYLWDWSVIADKGMRYENFIASHLLKAVHFWTDEGFGQFDLWYLRDKDQHEVDFLVTKDDKPWIMVEVKSSSKEPISKNLFLFQNALQAPYCFQVVMEDPYIDSDCFDAKNLHKPIKVPARTFLSQLV